MLTESDPLSHVRSYSYDAGSRLTSRTDAKSQTVSYTYNNRNELTNITYPDLSYTSFAYNDAGARTQMVDGTGTTSYSYDGLYRLTSVTFPGSRTVAYSYDDASRRTAITYPGGTNQVSYAYDAANELTSVTDWGSNSISHAYDDAGRLTSKTLPAGTGVVSSYAYDTADRLTGITHVKDGSTTIASVSYTLDAVGNRTGRVDQQGTHSYAYDNLYRLTSVTYPGPSTTSYAFDTFGNRTSKTGAGGTTNYAYDDADRITAVTPPSPAPVVSYTWDNNGDLTNRGSDTFSWDYEDRMTSATVNSVTSTFAYRGDGLRDSRTTGGNTTTFTWDIAGGLPVVLDDGSQYVYGAGLTAMKQSGAWFYYLADGLGSTMAIVDSSGAVQKGYTYDVYGRPTATGSLSNEFDFAGQQTDATGLQYLRARYMDPETGTFLSRDPLAATPEWVENPSAYAASSPVIFQDPTGLYSGNPTEKRWCKLSPRNGAQCLEVNAIANYVTTLVKEYFGPEGDVDGTPANAFKHCCWIGLTALRFGYDTARGFGQRHEAPNPGQEGPQTIASPLDRVLNSMMDLHNNEEGIGMAKNYVAACQGPSWTACAQAGKRAVIQGCLSAAKSGELWALKQ